MRLKSIVLAAAAMLVMGLILNGCGNKTTETKTETTAAAVTEANAEAGMKAPFQENEKAYAEIIDKLPKGQFYGFADMDEKNDALLVTDETFTNADGKLCAANATIYGLDKDGKIIEYGIVESTSTADPLATYEGCLMFAGHHHVGMTYIDESVSSLITKEDASESFDSKGNASYFYFSHDDEFEGEVEDDSKLISLLEKYEKAVAVRFTEVK